MTTAESVTYAPTANEARQAAAAKRQDVILDRGDLAAMTRVLAEIEQFRAKAERSIARMGALRTELADSLEMLRLQLK